MKLIMKIKIIVDYKMSCKIILRTGYECNQPLSKSNNKFSELESKNLCNRHRLIKYLNFQKELKKIYKTPYPELIQKDHFRQAFYSDEYNPLTYVKVKTSIERKFDEIYGELLKTDSTNNERRWEHFEKYFINNSYTTYDEEQKMKENIIQVSEYDLFNLQRKIDMLELEVKKFSS